MNKVTTFLLIVIVALCFTLSATMQSKAQEKGFAGIAPFAINNRVGFLDQATGRVYIYDNNINQCLFIGQITGLGNPIEIISAQNLNTSNPASL